LDPATFYVVPITDMVIFSTLIFFAFRNRFDSAAHKRFILIATNALLIAAIARWPFAFVERKPLPATFLSYVFLLMLVGYDLWSIRKVHRATAWGGVFMVVVQQLRVPFGQTSLWHAFADWMQQLAG
jgi:FtsH-binding integral membrane protein